MASQRRMSLRTALPDLNCGPLRKRTSLRASVIGMPKVTDTSFFFGVLRSAHVEKSSSEWALLKHVTRTNSIGTCSSELYIFNLLKLPPPPRAAICYTWFRMSVFLFY